MSRPALKSTLIGLEVFTGIGAIAGAVFLLPGMSVSYLKGSPFFSDYTIPALALGIIVGGSMLLAAVALLTRQRWDAQVSFAAGAALIFFELIEAGTIGLSSPLQPLFFVIGIAVSVLALRLHSSAIPHGSIGSRA